MANQMVFRRYEIKYLMTCDQRDAVLKAMEPYMTTDEYAHSSIRNIYYDTPNFRLIRESIEKPIYKEKLRIRSYGPAGAEDRVFVELKKKYKDVVYKRRISMPHIQAEACLSRRMSFPDSQIGQEIAYALDYYRELEPVVFLSYEREAFFERSGGDFRVTFDDNILYRQTELSLDSEVWGKPILQPGRVLMELKTCGALPLWMAQTLSRHKIFKTPFSKYGAAYRDIFIANQKGVRKYA